MLTHIHYSTTTVTNVVTTLITAVVKRAPAPAPAPPPAPMPGSGPGSHRPPVFIPPILAPFASAQISSACSCLSIKPTVTTTTTTAPLVVSYQTYKLQGIETHKLQVVTNTVTTTTTSIVQPPPACKPPGTPKCNLLNLDDIRACCNQCCYNNNGDPTNGQCCNF